MKMFASRFQIMMGVAQGYHIVRLSDGDDYGLYLSRFVNNFGTPLAARGSKTEIEALV